MPNSTVIAVASAKGGVGKTTTSINLGTALAGHDLDVVVVELDLAMANVVDFLSLDFDDGSDPSMHDVLAGDVPATDALYEAPGGATVAPSGTALDALGSIDMNHLSTAIEALERRFDVVVLDTGAGVNSATTTAMRLADETILVSTPRVASIRDTEKTRTIVENRGGEVGGLVLTQSGTGSSPGSQRLAEFLGVDLLCTVPQDASIHESQDAGVPVVERRPDSDAARAYLDGADALVEGGLGGKASSEPESESRPAGESTTDGQFGDELPADDPVAAEPAADEQSVPERAVTEQAADAPSVEEPPTAEVAAELVDDPETGGTETPPPSKESLEAQGWTFPGEMEDESATPEGPETEGEPEIADESEGAEEPEMTEGPATVERSAKADGPEVGEGPAVTEGPETTDEPVVTDDPEGDGQEAEIDVVDPRPRDRNLRPLTADGGETSLPDEAYGPASPRHVNVPTPQHVDVPAPEDRLPEALRASVDRDDADETAVDVDEGNDDDDDDGSDNSLAGRVTSFLRRSE